MQQLNAATLVAQRSPPRVAESRVAHATARRCCSPDLWNQAPPEAQALTLVQQAVLVYGAGARLPRANALAESLDDADVAVRAVAERLQGCLVGIAFVSLDGLLETVEFDDHDALHQPGFISFRGIAP